jgi:hypothetical protein
MGVDGRQSGSKLATQERANKDFWAKTFIAALMTAARTTRPTATGRHPTTPASGQQRCDEN